MTQQLIVDCATGAASYVDLTPEEEAALVAQQQEVEQEQTRQRVLAHEDEFERARAIANLMASPSVASDPALAQALSYILGV